MGCLELGTLFRLVDTLRYPKRPLDELVGRQCMPTDRLAWLDCWTLEYECALGFLVWLHPAHHYH